MIYEINKSNDMSKKTYQGGNSIYLWLLLFIINAVFTYVIAKYLVRNSKVFTAQAG